MCIVPLILNCINKNDHTPQDSVCKHYIYLKHIYTIIRSHFSGSFTSLCIYLFIFAPPNTLNSDSHCDNRVKFKGFKKRVLALFLKKIET